MSENSFSGCDDLEQVLWLYRTWDAKASDPTPDALARIAELTRPTVDEAARERALDELDDAVDDAVQGIGAEAPRQWLSDKLDRIIDALGYTTRRERLAAMTSDAAADDGYTAVNGFVDTRPVAPTPAVVELDAANLFRFARALKAFETLDPDPNVIPGPDDGMTITMCGVTAVARFTDAGWVLRIGGGDE